MSASAEVASWAEELQQLRTLPERLGALAAPGVQAAAVAQVSAGRAPDGTAWPLRKEGGRALQGAAGELSTVGTQRGVKVSLNGDSARHDAGHGNAVRRQVLPDAGEVPDSYAEAVDQAFLAEVR